MPDTDTVLVQEKPWWASRVFWFNILSLLVLIVGVILDSARLLDIPDQAASYLTVAVTIINVILRFMTTQPIGASGKTILLQAVRPGSRTMKRAGG